MSELHQLVLDDDAPGRATPQRSRPARPSARPAAHPSAHPSAWAGRVAAAPAPPVPADGPTRVYVYAKDGILRAGVVSQLRRSPQVRLAEEYGFDADGVSIVAADEVGEELLGALRAIRRSCTPKVIVIISRLTQAEAEATVEAGAWALVRRGDARPDRLVAAVRTAATASQPPATLADALGDLAEHLEPAPPARPARPEGLSDRDVEVLRLMADGHSTSGIARGLSYSESTIKNIIHAIVRELGARNRAHAVAMALRSELI